MVPGWKGGKALPFGGSFGEYSLNDFEEQPRRKKKGSSETLLGLLLAKRWCSGTQGSELGRGLSLEASCLMQKPLPANEQST